MSKSTITRLKSISDLHKFHQLKSPEHPLISLIDYSKIRPTAVNNEIRWVQEFFTISLKRNVVGKFRYGQQSYDFDEGVMTFFAPEQLITVQLIEEDLTTNQPSGHILAIHPDFFYGTSLANKMKKYPFFHYSVSEALFLSEKEEQIVKELFGNIESEYQANLDEFSQDIIISQVDLLLNYAERFYKRQFLTRKVTNHQILDTLETVMEAYFTNQIAEQQGVPKVNYLADQVHLSSDYLSSMLKSLTGQTTQQYIHNTLIEKAKVKLSTTALSVSEIAYQLGFEHPQSFNKLFKTKTKQTPLQFRMSYN